MAQYNPLEIVFLGERRHYYSYDEELYTSTFPFEWAESHLPGTGPKECLNCSLVGCWNGVFIGYCENCANYVYHFERGAGFLQIGEEFQGCDPSKYISNMYLKNITFDSIGDTGFIDSKNITNEPSHWVNITYDSEDNLTDFEYDTETE